MAIMMMLLFYVLVSFKEKSVNFIISSTCIVIVCNEGDLRLSDGPVKHKGRVEICFNNTWGTISDDRWSYFDGKVVCRQLGYSDSSKYYHS